MGWEFLVLASITQASMVKGEVGLEAVVDKDETRPQILEGPYPTLEPQPQAGLVLFSTMLCSHRG